jgi:hypothetical protein
VGVFLPLDRLNPPASVYLEEVSAGILAVLIPQGDQAPQMEGDLVGLLIVYGC